MDESNNSQEQQPTLLVPMGIQQLLRIAIAGAIVGLVTWGLAIILDTYVFKGLICQGSASMRCETSLDYASISAAIVGAAIGALALVKLQVFRSLLVVIAATISLWGLATLSEGYSWQMAGLLSTVFFLVAYSTFAWFARIRSFLLAMIVMLVLVIATRFVLSL